MYKDNLQIVQELRNEIAELKREPKNCYELSTLSNIELINECVRLNGIIRGQSRKINSMSDYEVDNKELLRVISRKNQKIARQKDKIRGWMEKCQS